MGDLEKKIDLERMIEILKVMKQEDPDAVQEGIDILAKELKRVEDDLPPGWDMKDFKTIEIPPEHKVSLGSTFQYLEDVAKKEEELEKLEEQIEKLQESLENAEDFDDVNVGHMELDELRIKRNRLRESLGIQAHPQSVYDKNHAEQLKKDFEQRKKEYDKAFTQGFTPEQLKKNLDRAIRGDFRDTVLAETEEERFHQFLEAKGTTLEKEKEKERNEFMKRLEERKKEYRASGMGIDFNKERTDEEEDERMQTLAKNIGTTQPPSKDVAGMYLPSAYGADIEAEQVFQQELHGIVDEMKVKLVDEKKILEGTLNPEYGKGDWGLPQIGFWSRMENELSNSNPVEEQWKSDSQNGSLITDLTPTSTHDSSSSSFIAEPSSPSFPTVSLRRQSTNSLSNLCSGKSDVSGTETDAMNESSECTVPMISVQMLGTLNEARWSPPPRSMESLAPSLLDVRS